MSRNPCKEGHQFRPEEAEELDDADVQSRFQKQEVVRDNLIEEAKLIKRVVPSKSLEKIYSFLEINVDNPNRVQIVIKGFKEMETQPSTSNSPITMKRTLKSYDSTDEESSVSPPHSKIRKYSTDQETTVVFQSSENEEVEGSKESMEFEDNISIVDSVTDYNDRLYEDEQSGISTSTTENTMRFEDEQSDISTSTTENTMRFEDEQSDISTSTTENTMRFEDEQSDISTSTTENTMRFAASFLPTIKHKILSLLQNSIGKLVTSTADPQPGSSSASESYDDEIERQYNTLREILQNADPSFLKETCNRIGNNEDQMLAFITDALEKSDYPTLEQYIKRQQVLSLQKKYIEDFKVEEFVGMFPDPSKYFLEEKKNQAETSKYAIPFLMSRYKKIREFDLHEKLRESEYSLTRTCLQLDKFQGPLLNEEREEFDWEVNVPLEVCTAILQEIAFIDNKEKISNYLREKQEKRKAAFLEAKANGELLECECCFDNEVMAEDMATCTEGHLFCKECIRKGAEVEIGEGATKFPCFSDCEAEFDLKTLQSVLNPLVFSKMLQRKQLEEVKAAGIEGLETCPYCDFACIPPREGKVFRCLNPDCMKETCRKCREPSHIPLRCEIVENADEVRMRTTIENRMTEALVRTCWKCGKKFIKESGCNKMRCTCGATMCYFCRKPYANFFDMFLFHKCPLYSSDLELHDKPVSEEAEKAKEELKASNPTVNLKSDPTKYEWPAPVQHKKRWPF